MQGQTYFCFPFKTAGTHVTTQALAVDVCFGVHPTLGFLLAQASPGNTAVTKADMVLVLMKLTVNQGRETNRSVPPRVY